MKLHEVPRNTKIRVLEHPASTPMSETVCKGDIILFHHLDGMYSYCTTEDGEVVHLGASTEVEIVNPQKDESGRV